jgi:CTP synthase
MQLAVVAFARHVLGYSDANTTENNPKSEHPIIHMIESQKELIAKRAYGGTMRLGGWDAQVKEGTQAFDLYQQGNDFINDQKGLTSERHRHRYEFNNAYTDEVENKGMTIAARSTAENLCEIIELNRDIHPFYLGTQGHPEYKSRPLHPHPLFVGFIDACKKQN